MRHKLIDQQPKTYALIFETGDELASGLKQFASKLKLSAGSFKAIGARSSVKLGWFDWKTKKYENAVVLEEQVELLSLIGDIALKDGEPQVHAHVIIGKADGTAHGGHLLEAVVRPTCEVVLTESPAHLLKMDEERGAGHPAESAVCAHFAASHSSIKDRRSPRAMGLHPIRN